MDVTELDTIFSIFSFPQHLQNEHSNTLCLYLSENWCIDASKLERVT